MPRRSNPRLTWIGRGLASAAASAGLLVSAVPVAAKTSAPLSPPRHGSASAFVSRLQRALHVGGIAGPRTWDALLGIKRQPTRASASVSQASGSSTGGYTIPAGIVQCESGGNYSAVNPQSGAGGAYQIIPSTWQAYGGQGLPQNAPKAEQDRIAAQIYARQGPSAWSC
jgi:hypothetical protein